MRSTRRRQSNAPAFYRDSADHLMDELEKLDALLQQRCEAFREQGQSGAGLAASRGVYITDQEVEGLLDPASRREAEQNAAKGADRWRTLGDAIAVRLAGSAERGIALTLPRLVQLFALSGFEAQALVVCLAPELRRTYDTLYAYLQDDVTRKRPSVNLVLQVLCSSDVERWNLRAAVFSDDARLFRHGILRRVEDSRSPSGSSGLAQFLQIDQRILHFILEDHTPDARLAGYAALVQPAVPFDSVPVDQTIKTHLMNLCKCVRGPSSRSVVIYLEGPQGVGKGDLALGLCTEWGCPLLHIDMELLLAREADVASALRLAFREGLLSDALVYVALGDVPLQERGRLKVWAKMLAQMVDEYGGFTIVSGEHRSLPVERVFGETTFCAIEMPMPDASVRRVAWARELGRFPSTVAEPLVTELAGQFRLTPAQIRNATAWIEQQRAMTGNDDEVTRGELYAACRHQSHHTLAELAVKIEPRRTWKDLVLPLAQQEQLTDLCRQVVHRHRVFDEWGFDRKLAHARGISALFAGPSGTGKTMAAEVIANELQLDLYKIDLSGVVNKYIGETEKNLARIFLEAEASNAILFFDEADALFGKRTKVSDAHDRYANLETSYLLQRVEAYEGVVILATNLRENMDEAFTRRIKFVIDFPFPDSASRMAIWQTHFPPEAPLDPGLDYDWLASELQITGGAIKNIVLNAAFFAASDGGVIGMDHLRRGARREFEKIGKLWNEQGFVPSPR